MSLKIVYEFNWERQVRACCAELKNNAFLDSKVAFVGNLIKNNHYLYKVEDNENGALIGFIVYKGNGIRTHIYNGDMIPTASYIRPHYAQNLIVQNEFDILTNTIINKN